MNDFTEGEGNQTPATYAPALKIVDSEKDVALRTVLGVTCSLSILGSILIILSYIVQKKRTKAREILVHISLMDLGVGLSNLIGLAVYFNKYYISGQDKKVTEPARHYIEHMCKAQAFFAAYCTLGSIFWTTALAGYLYTIIVCHRNPNLAVYFLRFCYIFCYGFAIAISLWLVLTGRLGFSPHDSSGWCTLIAKNPATEEPDVFITVFANDLWIYLAIFLIVLIYVALKCFLSNQVRTSNDENDMTSRKFWASMNFVDYKFMLIPVVFVLLRMWTCILTILTEYANYDVVTNQTVLYKILEYLSGIGDSGQGFTNAILFIAFTKSARQNFIRIICCKNCRKKKEESDEFRESTTFEQQVQGERVSYGSNQSFFQQT